MKNAQRLILTDLVDEMRSCDFFGRKYWLLMTNLVEIRVTYEQIGRISGKVSINLADWLDLVFQIIMKLYLCRYMMRFFRGWLLITSGSGSSFCWDIRLNDITYDQIGRIGLPIWYYCLPKCSHLSAISVITFCISGLNFLPFWSGNDSVIVVKPHFWRCLINKTNCCCICLILLL